MGAEGYALRILSLGWEGTHGWRQPPPTVCERKEGCRLTLGRGLRHVERAEA